METKKLGRAEALSIIDTFTEAAAGTQKTALLAIREFLLENTYSPEDCISAKKKLEEMLLRETPEEQAGDDFLKAQQDFLSGKLAQLPKPASGARVWCEYIAKTERWEPITLALATEK